MRCDEVRERLESFETGSIPAEIQDHLGRCPACQDVAKDLRMLWMGFRLVAKEPVPEASWGFAERLLRRWDEAQTKERSLASLFEQAGRRFVYGTLVLTLLILLALVAPASGPVRGVTSVDLMAAQPETVNLRADPILGEALPDNPETVRINSDSTEVQRNK